MQNVSLLGTLRGRMLALWVAPSMAAIIIVVLINAYNELELSKERARQSIQNEVNNTALILQSDNLRALQTAEVMAQAQQNGLYGNRQASLDFAREILLANEAFTAAYFGYEPNGDGNDAAATGESDMAGAIDETGRFLPYWFRDGQSLAIETLVDMDSSLYYDGVKKRFESSGKAKGFVTEPYSYQGVMIVEQVAPIVIGNQFMGIAGVDRALGYIDDLLSGLKQETGNDFMLLSRNNNFISSTLTNNLQTKTLTDTRYNALLTPLVNQAQNNNVVEAEDPVSGNDNFYAAAAIELGEWKLVQITSVDQVMGPLYFNVMRTLGLVLLAVVFVVLLSLYFTNSIGRRVKVLVAKADKVSIGDIDSVSRTATGKRQDEVDDLIVSVDRVVDAYREITQMASAIAAGNFNVQIAPKSNNDVVSHTLNDMAVKRKDMEDALKNHATVVKSKTDAQSKEIEGVSAAILQMNASIREVSEVASNASDSSESSVKAVDEVKRLISDVVSQATKLADEMTRTSEAVSQVSQSSDNINKIVDVINAIAEQTNLLALNAAIEAARAGEQGRGFAVVADEVRTLAARTQQSTEEIRTLISRLGNDVTRSVELVSGGVERAKTSTETAENANQALSSVVEQMNEVSGAMIQVAAAVQEQDATSAEISHNMTNIYDAVQELSRMVIK